MLINAKDSMNLVTIQNELHLMDLKVDKKESLRYRLSNRV